MASRSCDQDAARQVKVAAETVQLAVEMSVTSCAPLSSCAIEYARMAGPAIRSLRTSGVTTAMLVIVRSAGPQLVTDRAERGP
jgi:hypothetical protein